MPDQPELTTDLFCPQCGYNLRGIPQVRCPECGFGYNPGAIAELDWANAVLRLAAYRRLVLFGMVALGCSAMCALQSWGNPLMGFYCCELIVAAVSAAYFVSCYPDLKALLAFLAAPALFAAAIFAIEFYALLALGFVALALVQVWRLPTRLPYDGRSLPAPAARRLRRWHALAWASLLAAAVAALAAWPW